METPARSRLVQSLLATVLESTTDLVAALDTDFCFLAFNRAYQQEFERIFGSRIGIGASLRDALAHLPADQARALEMYRRAFQGEESTVTEKFGDERRSRNYYEIHYRPIREDDGRITGALHVIRDVTARERVERAARIEAELEELEAILNCMADAILIADPSGTILSMNPAARALLEIPPHEAGKRHLRMLPSLFEARQSDGSVLPLEDWPLARAMRGEVLHHVEVHVTNRRTGRSWIGSYSAAPVLNKTGDMILVVVAIRDVTEQRSVEQALRESEERSRLAMEAGRMYAFEWNPETDEVTRSHNYAEILGLPADAVIRTGKAFFQSVHPGDRERYIRTLGNLTPAERTYDTEFRTIGSDGRVATLHERGRALFDDAGRLARVVGMTADITSRKEAEDALRDSEERFRATFHQAAVGMAETSLEGQWLALNERFCQIVGYTQDELRRMTFRDITHPDDVATDIKASLRLVSGEIPTYSTEKRYVRKDGSIVWVMLFVSVVRDPHGRPKYFIAAMDDISERKQAETALSQSEQRFRLLADTIPHIVWVLRPDGSVEYANRRWQDYTGLAAAMVDNPEMLSRVVHPDDLSRCAAAWNTMLRAGEAVELEYRLRQGSDGAYRWKLGRGVPMRDAEGSIVRFFCTVTDIHDQKAVEQAIRETQKLESLGLLAGGVAHDFNNLLVGIQGNASLALDLVPADSKPAEYLKRVVQAGERAADLTRQMLAYAGKGDFTIEPLNVSELVRQISDLMRPAISKKIVFDFDLADEPPSVDADAGQVQQVLMNLVVNAAEAIGDDAGRISVRTGVQELDRAYIRRHLPQAGVEPGSFAFVEVRDSGCGMDEATKASIFDPFFTTKFAGRGLGLAAVAGIVRRHQGAIQVESAPGRGSSFLVLFPVGRPNPAPKARSRKQEDLSGTGTVLVVDDEPLVRQMARDALERYGYEVLTAGSGPDAIELFRAHSGRVSIIVLDVSMPVMSGREALAELRKIDSDVRVLLTSGYTEGETREMFAGYSIAGFIQKPYTARGLARALKAGRESRKTDAMEQKPVPDAVEISRESLDSLPAGLREQLRQATVRADFDRLMELTGEASGHDPALASALLSLVEDFEYDALSRLFEGGGPPR